MNITLQIDEPLFNLKQGDKILIDPTSSIYDHNSLVIAFEGEGSVPSVHRVERLEGVLHYWPPFRTTPALDLDIVAGPIVSINGEPYERS